MIKEYYQIKIEKNVLIPVSEVESSDEAKEIITKAVTEGKIDLIGSNADLNILCEGKITTSDYRLQKYKRLVIHNKKEV